jgi:hypothetical protein
MIEQNLLLVLTVATFVVAYSIPAKMSLADPAAEVVIQSRQNQSEPARKVFDQALKFTQKTGDERIRSFVVRRIGYLQSRRSVRCGQGQLS